MNLNNTYRQKLLNAIIFFTKNVKKPSKVKIFKLIYFLDFKHFQQTGRNVTNLDYFALEFGPVPLSFYEEVKDNEVPEDFHSSLVFRRLTLKRMKGKVEYLKLKRTQQKI